MANNSRVWNYWLGGKDNFAADRALADQMLEVAPDLRRIARAGKAFLVRAVRHLVADVGVRQFLDLSCGLPATDNNIHEVAQALTPDSAVVYVDDDPVVLAYARALLVGDRPGVTDHIDADVRDIGTVMTRAARTLDLAKPVAVIMSCVLGRVVDDHEARSLMERIVAALPPESHLIVSDRTFSQQQSRAQQIWADQGVQPPYRLRTPAQIGGLFEGLDLVAPGVVSATRWRPDIPGSEPAELDMFVCVARKPGVS